MGNNSFLFWKNAIRVNPELYRAFLLKVVLEGDSMKGIVEPLIKKYLKGFKVPPSFKPRRWTVEGIKEELSKNPTAEWEFRMMKREILKQRVTEVEQESVEVLTRFPMMSVRGLAESLKCSRNMAKRLHARFHDERKRNVITVDFSMQLPE